MSGKRRYPQWFDGHKVNEILFCEEFRKEHPIICIKGKFFTKDGLVEDEKNLETEIFNAIKFFVTEKVSNVVRSLMDVLKLMCHSEPLSMQTDRIHVANGTYFLDGHYTYKKEFCLNRLKVAYNEDAPKPERFLAFLNDLLYPEDIPTLQEYMGYCLLPTNKAQKMMVITGNGGEGKSRLGLVMRSILGDNMNNGSIQSLEKNRFFRANQEYKLLMVDDDMKMAALPETSYLKTMVTLEGKMDVEWKGKQGEQRIMYCRFLCFGNGPLTALYDRSFGFHRRQLILSVKDRDANRVDDPYLSDKLETEAEGIFLWMLEGLNRLIANRLTEMGRLNASGLNKWSHGVVSRVLNNQTYMGVMAYGKSYNNNYLDQKRRINNRDKSSYICVEGDFPPIVTPEEWYRAQEIKAGRVKESFSAKKGKKTTHCVQENRDLWGSRLRCTCGCGFRKNVWHKYDDKPNTYGYQCYNILNNGSANQRRKAGADDTGYCDQPMIADWKLELMGKKILELVFQDKRDLIDHTCNMIRKCLQTARPQGVTLSNIVGKMERIKFKKKMLLEMRTDGEITKQEFLDQRKKLDKELQELQAEYDSKAHNPVIEMDQPEWGKIQTALEEILDLSQPIPSPDLIRKFVAQIVPEGKTNFQWHLNLDGNQTTHVGMTVEGRKNKAVVSFATEGTCSPLAFGAVIEYPTLCRAATDKNAYLSAMQDRLLSRANPHTNPPRFITNRGVFCGYVRWLRSEDSDLESYLPLGSLGCCCTGQHQGCRNIRSNGRFQKRFRCMTPMEFHYAYAA